MKKRILALLLAASCLGTCLTACGKNSDETQTDEKPTAEKTTGQYQRMEAETVTSKYAYKAEYIDAPVDGYLNNCCVSGNSLYFMANVVTGQDSWVDTETGETYEYDTYEDVLFRMDLTTQECIRLDDVLLAAEPAEDNDEGWYYDTYVQGTAAGSDDSIWLYLQRSSYRFNIPEGVDEEENQYNYDYYESGATVDTLVHVASSGEIEAVLNIGGEEASNSAAGEVIVGNFYASTFFVDSNGYIYASDWDVVRVWDAEGSFLMELSLDDYSGSLSQYSADKIGVISYGETRSLKIIDPVKKDFGETLELPSFAYNILPGDDVYDFYYERNNKIYGYIAETDTTEKVIDWLECDVDDRYMQSFSILPDGRVFAMTQDYTTDEWKSQFILMERVDASTLPEKKTLTLACMYLDYEIRGQVVNFNRQNQEYRIVVKDYSEFNTDEDYSAGLTRLTTEIGSGVMPDLLCTSGLPVRQYAAKGLLQDIWPMLDADETLSREDLVTEVLDALSVDGKLYELPVSFTLSTVAGLEKVVGGYESWTLADLQDAMTKLQDGASIFSQTTTRAEILSTCIAQSFDAFVDWENGSCNFDCDEFKTLLEFAASFPADFDYSDYEYVSDYSRLRNGEQLLTTLSFYGFDELYAQFKALDDQPCFVGYPTASTGTPVRSTFSCDTCVAVTAACTETDAAWAFLCSLLSDEHQENVWEFPITRSAFDKKLAEAMEQEFYTDPETGEQIEQSKGGIGYGDDEMIEIYAVTPEQRDIFMNLLENTTTVYSTDQSILEIVNEVTGSYFAGEKSLDETVKIIQNRVNLYVMEQS